MVVTIYDSNFEVVLDEFVVDQLFPAVRGPRGALNPLFYNIDFDDDRVAPAMYAGETYYIGLSGTGVGRYTLSVTADAVPPETDGDGIYDNNHSTIFEIPDAGNWAAAQLYELSFGGGAGNPNDLSNRANTSQFPYPGYHNNSFFTVPDGTALGIQGDLGLIETPGDSDLYFFRAPQSGTIEVRTASVNILDEFASIVGNGASTGTKTYSSQLDAKLTVFSNDFVMLATNDDTFAIKSEREVTHIGTFEDRTFRPRDPRVVFDVTSGEGYFVLVESAQRQAFLDAQDSGDYSEVDWRSAIGSYEMMVNAVPNLGYEDDYSNAFAPDTTTVVPIGEATGDGSILGEIDNNAFNPADVDTFSFIAPQSGPISITVTRTSGLLEPDVAVFEETAFNLITAGNSGPDGSVTVMYNAKKGERFYVSVQSIIGSEGQYEMTIDGAGGSDDHGSDPKWYSASVLEVLDFNGSASGTGTIENAGDTDVFKFDPMSFDLRDDLRHGGVAVLRPVRADLRGRGRSRRQPEDASDRIRQRLGHQPGLVRGVLGDEARPRHVHR